MYVHFSISQIQDTDDDKKSTRKSWRGMMFFLLISLVTILYLEYCGWIQSAQ